MHYKIDFWIKFYNTSIKHADFVMSYTDMKKDPEISFIKLLDFLEWYLDEELVRKSIIFSSFKNVKKMGEQTNQKYGNGPKDGKFKGEFTRSGEESQFKYELKEETIRGNTYKTFASAPKTLGEYFQFALKPSFLPKCVKLHQNAPGSTKQGADLLINVEALYLRGVKTGPT